MFARPGPSIQMKKELASEDPVVLALAELVHGATLLKAVRNGKPHFRNFSISKDLKKLVWNSANKKDAGVPISEIAEIIHGQKTKTFKDNPVPEYELMSFSVMWGKRSLDIVCKDLREYEAWTRGLEALLEGFLDVDAVMAVYTKHQRGSQLKVAYDAQGQAKIAVHEAPCDAYTWGSGACGILGHGEEDDEKTPRVLEAVLGRGVKQLALAGTHSIALESTSGEVYSWGNGQFGKLGHKNLHPRFLPLRIGGLPDDVCHISCGSLHSAAVLEDGSVFTWGQASDPECGRLGYACSRRSTTPMKVMELKEECVLIVACGFGHTVALTEDFAVITFGDNSVGQLGTGEGVGDNFQTLYFGEDVDIEKVVCGHHHSAAISSAGDLYMWGSNTHGQCAVGDKSVIWKPQRIPLPERVEDIACGEFHTVAVVETGMMYSCGSNADNQLGMGPAAKKTKFTAMTPLSTASSNVKFVKVAAGSNTSAAVTDTNRLYTWGSGEYGVLGHGDNKPRFVPTEVSCLNDKMVQSIYIGCQHMGALTLNTWVADDEAKLCMSCKLKFTTVRRRHHCRQCGGVFCSHCTTKRYPLLDKGFSDPVRVCDRCHALLTRKGAI